MSMIELMMAITLLAVGMSAVMALIAGSVATNNRNKLDTTATNLSQMMLERLIAAGVNPTSSFTVTDCASNVLAVDPTGSTSGRGAAIVTSGLDAGNIDFSSNPSPSSGYSINYVACGSAGTRATYNIRWNVTILQGTTDANAVTKQIRVATRQIAAATDGPNRLKFFAPPATLRTVIGRPWNP